MAKELRLPGNFNSYPKGPKAPHYAPHAQPTISAPQALARQAQRHIQNVVIKIPGGRGGEISAPVVWSRGAQRTIEAPLPKEQRSQRTIEGPSVTDADPAGNYYFALEVNNIEVAHFLECSGLKSHCTVYEIFEGGYNGHVHKRPGQSKWDNIVLKFATSASTYLLEWRDAYLTDNFDQRTAYSGSIAVMNNAGQVVRRYHFRNAWPVSWEGPKLAAGGSELAVETLEIAHDGLTISTDEWNASTTGY